MRLSDVVPALLMLALSGAIALDTRSLSFWDDTTPGPAFLQGIGLGLVFVPLSVRQYARATPK